MSDWSPVLVGVLLGAMTVAAYLAGRSSNRLAQMELAASISVAKQEVGWEYQRYRIQSLRMDWVTLGVEGRREYVRTWGRPKWADVTLEHDPLGGVPKVHQVRGPVP